MGMGLKAINGAQRRDEEGNFVVSSMADFALQIAQRLEGAGTFAPTAAKPSQSTRFQP